MHVFKKTLISIITCSLLIMSVGAEEPVTEEAETPLVYNTEEGEDSVADTEKDTTVVADDENAEDVVDNSTDIDNVEASTLEDNVSSEPAEEVSNPVEDTPTIELGEFKNEVTYNEEHTVATIVVEYLGECTELNLANEGIVQQMVNTGVYQVNLEKGDWTNKIAFDVLVNGIVPLEINVWNEDTLVGTKIVMTSVTGLNNDALIFEPNQASTYEITSSDVGSTDSRSIELSYITNVSYTWSIPTELTMTDINDSLSISVNNSSLAPETALRVRMNTSNGFNLIHSDPSIDDDLTYIVNDANDNRVHDGDVILDHLFNQESSSNTLNIDITKMPLFSGEYKDTWNFTASVERLLSDLYTGQVVTISNLGTTHNLINMKIYGVGYQAKSNGKNLWNEEWETGGYNYVGGTKTYDISRIRSAEKIDVSSYAGQSIYITHDLHIFAYDEAGVYIGYKNIGAGNGYNVEEGTYYITFETLVTYGGTYKNDIAISLDKNVKYEPYSNLKPSPSLEAPSEIQNVQNPSIVVSGSKNQFDYDTFKSSSSYVENNYTMRDYQLLPNTKYYLKIINRLYNDKVGVWLLQPTDNLINVSGYIGLTSNYVLQNTFTTKQDGIIKIGVTDVVDEDYLKDNLIISTSEILTDVFEPFAGLQKNDFTIHSQCHSGI